jgi:hypothetical protein
MIRNWLFMRRHMKACRKLQALRDANLRAPATISYAKHRTAALKHRQAT